MTISSRLVSLSNACNGGQAASLPGMPDFLEKLHNAALMAKNLEVGIHDYAGVIKSSEGTRQASQERLGGDNSHPGGSGQIYAWGGRRRHVFGYATFQPSGQTFGTLCSEMMVQFVTEEVKKRR